MLVSDVTRYVRSIDFDAFRYEGFEPQVMYVGETCRVIATSIAPGAQGPPRHVHDVDQLCFVLRGRLHVELGTEVVVAGPETFVYVPAGTPHRNWNDGDEPELHLEVLAPGPNPSALPWTETDRTDAPGGHFVRALADVEVDPSVSFFDRRFLVQRSDGSEGAMLYEATIAPGGAHPNLHVHDQFDQFCWVLEGELSVEIALDSCVAGPNSLVVLAAGVPHRLWNDGPDPERHLALITPAPPVGLRGDMPVIFAADPTAAR